MAETLYTPDGRTHVLVGSTTLESIVREYAGDEAAALVRAAPEREERLRHFIEDCAEKLQTAALMMEPECADTINAIQEVIDQIYSII